MCNPILRYGGVKSERFAVKRLHVSLDYYLLFVFYGWGFEELYWGFRLTSRMNSKEIKTL